jgi:hypothetical protein
VEKADLGLCGEKVVVDEGNCVVASRGVEVITFQFPVLFGIVRYMVVQFDRVFKDCMQVKGSSA